MADKGAVMNYDFGPKRHWRRWVWNRILERSEKPANEICVYLAGDKDFDRPIAMAKGYSGGNMIAVERNQNALYSLRSKSVLAIDADFYDAVNAICLKRPVGVIYADLCCGLRQITVDSCIRWCMSPNLGGAVFAFNLLRGRDADTNELRNSIPEPIKQRFFQLIGCDNIKHRGANLWSFVIVTHLKQILVGAPGEDDDEYFNDLLHFAFHLTRPAFNTYKSESGQYFDTVVFRSPLDRGAPKRAERLYQEIYEPEMERDGFMKAKRSAAAVFAHRTRRVVA